MCKCHDYLEPKNVSVEGILLMSPECWENGEQATLEDFYNAYEKALPYLIDQE